jgi:hypothetical protein
MIISPMADYALRIADRQDGQNNPSMIAGIHAVNAVANLALPVTMTSMSNPHFMSYAYKGLPAETFGIQRAIDSRRNFQMMSSKSYQIGSKAAARLGPKAAHIGGKFAVKAIPGIGWAMLAYDAYDFVVNRRLFGIRL